MQAAKSNISRRQFMKLSGGFTIGITATALVPTLISCEDGTVERDWAEKTVTAWVDLREDGQLTIYSPAAEMGQGSLTALPVIFAEELDADWSKVNIVPAPVDADTYGSPGWSPDAPKMLLNVGSRTVRSYFNSLRQAGAQARYVLLHSVAKAWEVPVEALTTEASVVTHSNSGRSIAYGDIVPLLEIPEAIPEIPQDQLKDPKDFRLIGKVNTRVDIPSKTNGSAQFSMDAQVPNMLYGVIERGAMHGAKPSLRNEAAIRANDALVDLVALDHGIGIIARSLEKALEIKDQLEIDWDQNVPAAQHSSQSAYGDLAKIAATQKEGNIRNKKGDVGKAMRSAAKTYTADYKNDYVYHAQMEPLNAIASVAEDGQSAEVWAGTQGPGFVAGAVAEVLGIEASRVTLHQHYLGGGLGRRSSHDNIIEAVQLSNAVRQPVKLVWTREDDLRYGMYRPMSLQRMEAGTDADGKLLAFSHTIVGDGSGLLASGAANEFYDIPNQKVDLRTINNGIRLKHWRSVGHGPNKFAIEAFIDEIAADQGADPLEYRRKLMQPYPRALATLEKVAEMAGWGKEIPEGRARGIAFGERSGSLSSGIAEISVNRETGKIKVHHFWASLDAGIVIQPDNVVAQMEGGIVMGISSVLSEQITIEKGMVQQSNFDDYAILRMQDIPESIDIAIIPSTEAPQGVGESSTPLVAGAIANAFLALTGKPLRHLPFTPERVKTVLNS